MAKLPRVTAKLFATSAGVTGVGVYASKNQTGVFTASTDPAAIQSSSWLTGWTPAQYQGVFAPYYQDRNAVDLVIFYQLAYLLQEGIPEYDAATTYYQNSVVSYNGKVYQSLLDANTGNTPPASGVNTYWRTVAFPSMSLAQSPTRTVLTSGSGTYTPPANCVRIRVRLVGGGGGGGTDSGTNGSAGAATTFGTLTGGGGSGGYSSVPSNGHGAGGAGGAASGGDINVAGAPGHNATVGPEMAGGGGCTAFGGGTRDSEHVYVSYGFVYAGENAAANSGAGGQGGTVNLGYAEATALGGGGGAGGYVEKIITALAASYAYSVGAGGAGAPAGGSIGGITPNGGNGGSGVIVIDEFYY